MQTILIDYKFHHYGSPAYYELIKKLDESKKYNLNLIFLLDQNSKHLYQKNKIQVDGLKTSIKVLPYYSLSILQNSKIEFLLNKLIQYIKLTLLLKSRSIYYIDRDNIPLANFLKLKKGLIVFRLLGVTKKLFENVRKSNKIISCMYKTPLKNKSSIIISSNDGSWADQLKNLLNKPNFHILFNGYMEIECTEKIDNPTFQILSVARLEKGKGHFNFLSAIKTLSFLTNKRFKVLIIGDGALKCDLENFCVNNKMESYVEFTGIVEHNEMAKYYSSSSILVSLNEFGLFSNTVIEACYHELPIIALDNPIISNEKKNNFLLVDKGNLNKIPDYIKRLMNDEKFYNKYKNLSKDFFSKNITSWDRRINKELKIINV